jgi:hypothetical protein
MTSNVEMTDTEWAVEAAARAMYISKYWRRAITEPDGQLKDRSHYNHLAGRTWDSGQAGYSMYQEFRMLAEAAVPAARPGILADVADKVESAVIERAETESDSDRQKPLTLLRGTDVATWIRHESVRPLVKAYVEASVRLSSKSEESEAVEVEEWGIENEEGVYVLDEASAREVADDDQKLVRKINGEWVEAE